jgi:hypothetical protein
MSSPFSRARAAVKDPAIADLVRREQDAEKQGDADHQSRTWSFITGPRAFLLKA